MCQCQCKQPSEQSASLTRQYPALTNSTATSTYVGVKAKALVQQCLTVGRHRSTQLFKDALRDRGGKRAEAVLLAAQEHVAEALALVLAALELGHADLRGLVCVACLFPDAPVHVSRARAQTMHTHACKHACNKACHMLGSRGEVEATSASSNNAVSQHHNTTENPETPTQSHQRISARRNSKPCLRA